MRGKLPDFSSPVKAPSLSGLKDSFNMGLLDRRRMERVSKFYLVTVVDVEIYGSSLFSA